MPDKTIVTQQHPDYQDRVYDWEKFRYIMNGGDDFLACYLEPYDGEDADAFARRTRMTPIPGFAASAITEIGNAVFQRLAAVRRRGGVKSWRDAVSGDLRGVDLRGSDMNKFMGADVLPELLAMGKVGVFVDFPIIPEGATLDQTGNLRPYLYMIRTEDILNWEYNDRDNPNEFKMLLIRERVDNNEDPGLSLVGLPDERISRYRLMWILDETTAPTPEDIGKVAVAYYDETGMEVTRDFEPAASFEVLELRKIPFVLMETNKSLLDDVANHQIALLNLESSDVNYGWRSNVPFYTEQQDLTHNNSHLHGADNFDDTEDGDNNPNVKIGSVDGRAYGQGLDRPQFVAPPSEPLEVSMRKQNNLKKDIRQLVHLAVSTMEPTRGSAVSKEMDQSGLEAGLSSYGQLLEHAERACAQFWHIFEGSSDDFSINYPNRYALKSDEDRRRDAEQLSKSRHVVPSELFRQQIDMEIAVTLLGGKIDDTVLDQILEEIRTAKYPTADPAVINAGVELGTISRESGSVAQGWEPGEAKKATKERAARELARAMAQSGNPENLAARGLDDEPAEAREEKKNDELSDS